MGVPFEFGSCKEILEGNNAAIATTTSTTTLTGSLPIDWHLSPLSIFTRGRSIDSSTAMKYNITALDVSPSRSPDP